MYSILIADDEIASIKYVRNLIAGFMPGFQVIKEAFSGLEAFEYLQKQPVDLLITDARMPGMDGIELSQKARALLPRLEIVVVSGYADFEYAKGALSAGVNEYLLKPLNIQHTIDVLSGIEKKLNARYSLERREAMESLLAGAGPESGEIERLFGGTRCYLGMIRCGNLPSKRSMTENMRAIPEAGGLLLVRMRDDMEWLAAADEIRGFAEKMQEASKKACPEEASTIACYKEKKPLASLKDTAFSLSRAVDTHLVIGKSRLLFMPAGAPPPAASMMTSELRQLDYCLQSGNFELMKDVLFTWALEWDQRCLTQRTVEALLWQIAEHAMLRMPQDPARRQAVRDEVDELFQYARNTGDLMGGFFDVLFAPMAGRRNQQQAGDLIAEILRYVQDHYQEPLTIQTACAQFGISQTYLSRLFRRYEHTTFNDYLTFCRMEAAKKLIREQAGIKLRDVAQLSGYEDPAYFSKVFRQREGMTPQQYTKEQDVQ